MALSQDHMVSAQEIMCVLAPLCNPEPHKTQSRF